MGNALVLIAFLDASIAVAPSCESRTSPERILRVFGSILAQRPAEPCLHWRLRKFDSRSP